MGTQIRFKNEKEGERTWEPGIKRPEAMSNEFEGAAKRSSRRHRGIISGGTLTEIRICPGDMVSVSGSISALGAGGGIVTTMSSNGTVGEGGQPLVIVLESSATAE